MFLISSDSLFHFILYICGSELMFLFLCAWFWSFCVPLPDSRDPFFVSQFPSTLVLRRGQQVQIRCSWNISITSAEVKWFKDYRTLTLSRTDSVIHTQASEHDSALVIKNADLHDAGFYECEVTQDIPQLSKVNGTGTNVTFQTETG